MCCIWNARGSRVMPGGVDIILPLDQIAAALVNSGPSQSQRKVNAN